MFKGRKQELKYLNSEYRKKGNKLVVLYGRRRIGKSELMKEFAVNKKHIFFSSDLSIEHEQLRQFSRKVYEFTGEKFLENQQFDNWDNLFSYIFEKLKNVLIIIDEFPYLCYSNTALPSVLQRHWDGLSQSKNIFLIICGSYMSFMEKEVLSSKSPLFGRRTGQILLQPFSFNEAEQFFPGYSKENKIYSYAILGGTPAYLAKFNPKHSLWKNLELNVLNKNSYLYGEPHFLLREELNEPALYFAILKAISYGKTKLNEISQDTGINDVNKINKYITVLRELKIIKREVPVTEKIQDKSKRGIYSLEDPFFRFWFRFVYSNKSYLEEGDLRYTLDFIRKSLDTFTGYIFEQICIEKFKNMNSENKLPFKADKIGRWWNKNSEIDIFAFNSSGQYIFAECKWTDRKTGLNLLEQLKIKSECFPDAKEKYFAFFSKSGFTVELIEISREEKNIILFNY